MFTPISRSSSRRTVKKSGGESWRNEALFKINTNLRLSDRSLLNSSHLQLFFLVPIVRRIQESCDICSPLHHRKLSRYDSSSECLHFVLKLFCSYYFLGDENALPHCQNHFPFLYVILSWLWGNQWESYPWNEVDETPLKKWLKMSAAVVNTGQSVFKVFLRSVYNDSGVSISTDGRRNASATLLIEVGYFFSTKKK